MSDAIEDGELRAFVDGEPTDEMEDRRDNTVSNILEGKNLDRMSEEELVDLILLTWEEGD